MIYVLQEELKHKLSEGNKFITEYEVASHVFAVEQVLACEDASFCPLQQQQLGRKDRILQQQQQKLEEAQQRAQEVGLGRVDGKALSQFLKLDGNQAAGDTCRRNRCPAA